MKKPLILLLILLLSISLTACSNESEVEFIGTITEINGQIAIVSAEEVEDIRRSGDLVEVDLSKNKEVEFRVGDKVKVVYDGAIQEKYPLGINTVFVELLERKLNHIEKKTTYDKVSAYMKKESIEVFSPYYELLDFQISDYQEKAVDGKIEAIFRYTIISKNYDRDPDTVEYIKKAKESGNKNYKQMYDEYLQPREMNFDLKAVVDEKSTITLYSNIAPKGVQWEETKMIDYILKE